MTELLQDAQVGDLPARKSMQIGFIGVGKLGLPVAIAIEMHGHTVHAYDVNPAVRPGARPEDLFTTREAGPGNVGDLRDIAKKTRSLHFYASAAEACALSDLVFIAVQTPHEPLYEGCTRVPPTRADFCYDHLCAAVQAVSDAAAALDRPLHAVIISTVLPGTVRSRVLPILHPHVRLSYSPLFIAMGTVVQDFLHPEFVLLGRHDEGTGALVKQFYSSLHNAPVFETTIENAELIKVCYNTYIGMKIGYANTVMELCHGLPNTDVDVVSTAIGMADKRLMSPACLRGGMGDGGGCHPRDNIAMSWLADRVGLSFNLFDAVMSGRERQTEFLADVIQQHAREFAQGLKSDRGMLQEGTSAQGRDDSDPPAGSSDPVARVVLNHATPALSAEVPVVLLGKAFKPDTNITTGSPAVLLGNILRERGVPFTFADPYCTGSDVVPLDDSLSGRPRLYFVSCKHSVFASLVFAPGSVVIDPHRYIPQGDAGVAAPVDALGCLPRERAPRAVQRAKAETGTGTGRVQEAHNNKGVKVVYIGVGPAVEG